MSRDSAAFTLRAGKAEHLLVLPLSVLSLSLKAARSWLSWLKWLALVSSEIFRPYKLQPKEKILKENELRSKVLKKFEIEKILKHKIFKT